MLTKYKDKNNYETLAFCLEALKINMYPVELIITDEVIKELYNLICTLDKKTNKNDLNNFKINYYNEIESKRFMSFNTEIRELMDKLFIEVCYSYTNDFCIREYLEKSDKYDNYYNVELASTDYEDISYHQDYKELNNHLPLNVNVIANLKNKQILTYYNDKIVDITSYNNNREFIDELDCLSFDSLVSLEHLDTFLSMK